MQWISHLGEQGDANRTAIFSYDSILFSPFNYIALPVEHARLNLRHDIAIAPQFFERVRSVQRYSRGYVEVLRARRALVLQLWEETENAVIKVM